MSTTWQPEDSSFRDTGSQWFHKGTPSLQPESPEVRCLEKCACMSVCLCLKVFRHTHTQKRWVCVCVRMCVKQTTFNREMFKHDMCFCFALQWPPFLWPPQSCVFLYVCALKRFCPKNYKTMTKLSVKCFYCDQSLMYRLYFLLPNTYRVKISISNE